MAGDFASLGGTILGIASAIQSLGNNSYVANAEWRKFPRQVEVLQEKVDFWKTEASKFPGVSADPTLIKRLEAAKTLLKKEQVKLEKRAKSSWSGCWALVSMTIFPAQVGLSIQDATEAFDDIPRTLRSRQETRDLLNKENKCTAVSTFIAADTRYVPLVEKEAEICNALEDAEGPGVILLHGEPGVGKSTLARNMVVHYTTLDKKTFDIVILLDCSSGAKTVDTHLKIIRHLGYQPIASTQEAGEGDQIKIQLRDLLTAQKVLLILDDVSDGNLLNEIVELCGIEVKCLVTSVHGDLCESELEKDKYVCVSIQVVAPEIARKILASHLEHEIPQAFKELVDKMILQTGCIPLAISSLAYLIGHEGLQDRHVWETASKDFFKALKSEVPTATRVLGGKYLKSFWATTRLAMDKLDEDAKNLLVLTHACEGPSVPEKIVQLLYSSEKLMGVVGNFSTARRQLVNRYSMIKTSPSAKNLGAEENNWSMHSLLRLYITDDSEMKKRRDSMFISVCPDKDAAEQVIVDENDMEEKMVTAVCALYLEGELGKRAVSRSGLDMDKNFFLRGLKFRGLDMDKNAYVRGFRKEAIEPLTCLLASITTTARDYAVKVFVRYICNDGDLYLKGILYILPLSSDLAAPATMLKVLKNITNPNLLRGFQLSPDDEDIPGLLNTLVDHLAEGADLDNGVLMAAGEVLVHFTDRHFFVRMKYRNDWHGTGRNLVEDWLTKSLVSPGESALERTVKLLIAIPDPQLQVHCAQLLLNIMEGRVIFGSTFGGKQKVQILAGWGGVMAWLVNSLQYKNENPPLQEAAAEALQYMALNAPMKLKVDILNLQGLLPKLVWSLSIHDDFIY